MADENSIYNIMEYVGAKAYSKNDIVVVLERFSSDNYPGNGGFQVPKSATYYYSTNSSSSVPADSPSADSTLWAGTTRYQDRIKPEFIWNPSYNISVENSPRINSVVFGNGYEQRIKDGIFNLEKLEPFGDGGHHMGGTRMGTDKYKSVVNTDLKIHDIDNLYVSGSSNFFTSGYTNPTFTIIQFAIRLAEKLNERLRSA